MLCRSQKLFTIKKKKCFSRAAECGAWHVSVIERINNAIKTKRARAGVRRLGKEEFKKRLMEDLKAND